MTKSKPNRAEKQSAVTKEDIAAAKKISDLAHSRKDGWISSTEVKLRLKSK